VPIAASAADLGLRPRPALPHSVKLTLMLLQQQYRPASQDMLKAIRRP
jgi:hypothetical protein